MKYFVGIIFLCLFSCNEEIREKFSCEDFRTGEFTYARKYTYEGNELEFPKEMKLDTVRFTRKDNQQIEYYHEEGKTEISEIRWKGNCSYDLIILKSDLKINEAGDRISTRITGRTDSSYTFVSNTKHGELKGMIIKLK